MAELALVTGRGPALLTIYDGRCPLVRDEDVVAFGFRDEWKAQSYGSPPLAEKIKAIGLEEVRRMRLGPAAREALADVSGQDTRDFWIHFDADVLDDAIMPAVDSRLPGGLSWLEIKHILSAALAHPSAVGMEVTIFNPRLDTDAANKILPAEKDCDKTEADFRKKIRKLEKLVLKRQREATGAKGKARKKK